MIKISKLVPSYTWRDLPYLKDEIGLGVFLGFFTIFIFHFCIQCWNENKLAFIIGLILFVFCAIGGLLPNIEDTDDSNS